MGTAVLAAGLIVAPASAAQASTHQPVRPTESIAACEVTDATLSWGTLARWRAYIQGSIAHGSWSEEGNVSYELPDFVWTEGEGILATTGEMGSVTLDGEVLFTGHGGNLQVRVGSPTFEIVDAEEAYLVLDLSSTKPSGEDDIMVTQERAVKLDIAGTMTADGDTLTFANIEGQLTAEGAAAFGGFYSAGEPVDPVTLVVTAGNGCEFLASAPEDSEEGDVATSPESEESESVDETPGADETEAAEEPAEAEDVNNWLLVGIIAGALALGAIAGGVIAAVKRKSAAQSGHNGNG